MDLTLPDIAALMRLTLQAPRKGARRIMDMNMPIGARWLALVLVVTLGTICSHLLLSLVPAQQRETMPILTAGPMVTVVLQVGFSALFARLIVLGGQMRGGTGTFPDALVLLAWLQFIQLCLTAGLLLVAMLLPGLVVLVALLGFVVLLLWLLTNIVAELHGFRSLLSVFGGLLAGAFVFTFVVEMLLMLFLGNPPAGA